MRIIGIALSILGFVGILVFGIQAIQETETFSFLGVDIGVSSANWTPTITSAVILLIGTVLIRLSRTRRR